MRKRAALTTGVIAALAIAAPVAEASATPFQLPAFHLPAYGGFPAFNPVPFSGVGGGYGGAGYGGAGYGGAGYGGAGVGEPFAGVAVAIGPTVIGSAFNGGTTVVVSTGPAAGSVNASP
jgi:hypothetical protein